MHFEILAEDDSGKIALSELITRLLGVSDVNTFRIVSYKGIGSLPRNLDKETDPKKKVLLDKLPTLLRAYGRTFEGYGQDYAAMLIIVCDLDNRDGSKFREELEGVLQSCHPELNAKFIFAVEEGEAWLMGDRQAVLSAYPNAKTSVLEAYIQDSICGTWETLADAIYPTGASGLKKEGFPKTGIVKCEWASRIAPHVIIERNVSPSFGELVTTIRNARDE